MATWKKAESRLAAVFGTRRRPLSGGNSGTGRDDSFHPRLFLECKWSKRHTMWTLWTKTKTLAAKERRTPVVGLCEKNRPGMLLVFHVADFPKVASEYYAAQGLSLVRVPTRFRKTVETFVRDLVTANTPKPVRVKTPI